MAWEIINATLPDGQKAAIQIGGENIFSIGPPAGFSHAIDADGLWVVPGLIDEHVHFRTPGEEHKEDWFTGTNAALAGGYTTVADMPNNKEPITTVQRLLKKMIAIGDKIPIGYRLWLAGVPSRISELDNMRGWRIIAGVKVYFDLSTGGLIVRDRVDRLAIASKCAEQRKVMAVHAESERIRLANEARIGRPFTVSDHCLIRSPESEHEAIKEAIEIQQCTGVEMLICHVSTVAGFEEILRAQDRGQNIHIEVCPHHLVLNSHLLDREDGAFFKVNPALRSPREAEILLDYFCAGRATTLAGDHAPHTIEEKQQQKYEEIPSGMPVIQNTFSLMYPLVAAGRMPLPTLINMMSRNPARILGMRDVGEIVQGARADLMLFDPACEVAFKNEEQLTKSKWSPFALAGMRGMGVPKIVVSRGRIRYCGGAFVRD